MKKKLNKVRERGYVKKGPVKSLIRFFAVPKGMNDIRMVHDSTASGFNDSVWVPSFDLPTVETLLQGTGPKSWMVDLDIGDMFLNFMLAEDARELVGIDVSLYFNEDRKKGEFNRVKWERWVRCAMGLKISPNHAIRAVIFAKEFLKGDPSQLDNPFCYKSVELNLPGTETYDPTLSWFRVMDHNDQLAAILAIYVDDERVHCSSEDLAWKAAHQIATRESYLGIQDAARKRRQPSQNAGAWAGSIVRTNDTEVGILVSEERWTKTRQMIRKWVDKLRKDQYQKLDLKELVSDRGFLIYVTRTYKPMVLYLKGIHLTIDGWRKNRDTDGWKHITRYLAGEDTSPFLESEDEYPDFVCPVPRLRSDLEALVKLTESVTAPIVIVQSSRIYVVKYGFGDASGGGFGSSLTSPNGVEIHIGTWNEKSSGTSSNLREMANFVVRLELEASMGKLEGVEVFLFTDNSTTEAAFFNGTTSSKTLFDLVLRLKDLQMKFSAKIHLIHVAGSRMIEQGTDGISRGNLMEGVMTGKSMLSFVPIHLTAIERSKSLLRWI